NWLNLEGGCSCNVRPMGRDLVLLSSEVPNELMATVHCGKEWLNNCFLNIRLWSPHAVSKQRFIWLRCFGIPLHLWNLSFFTKVAEG
ncbi:hypothetical protein Ancab_031411, partial [Ancistrocladus abbreviatus]